MSNFLTTLFAIVVLLAVAAIAFCIYKQNQKTIKELSDENDVLNESETESDSKDDDNNEEVVIPEHCKIKDEIEDMPNKYFYNIHKYTSVRGKYMYCVVVSAIIKGRNYRIICPFGFYPYLNSYTDKVKTKIKSMFNEELTAEEFLKMGCDKNNNLGIRVQSLDD